MIFLAVLVTFSKEVRDGFLNYKPTKLPSYLKKERKKERKKETNKHDTHNLNHFN